jgi:twitching motility protein PilT
MHDSDHDPRDAAGASPSGSTGRPKPYAGPLAGGSDFASDVAHLAGGPVAASHPPLGGGVSSAMAMGGAAMPASGSGAARGLTIQQLLRDAVDRGASDLHLTAGIPPVFRVDGALRVMEGCPPMSRDQLRKIVYSFLNDDQRAEFERKLELDCSLEIASVGRFRVNVHRQRGSTEAALRVVHDEIRGLRDLGLPKIIEELARRRSGLFLVTGPTGSGKTTTMAAIVDQINRERREMIITIEDPIEYIHRPKKSIVKQREVHADTLSFSNALRHALRQDPDVICIGEMRDLETISTALTAAETGTSSSRRSTRPTPAKRSTASSTSSRRTSRRRSECRWRARSWPSFRSS